MTTTMSSSARCHHHHLAIAQRTAHGPMSGSSAITVVGTANTGYLQNLVFHQNAMALAVVPMEKPAGAVDWRASPTRA